jgi:hypothetical protein
VSGNKYFFMSGILFLLWFTCTFYACSWWLSFKCHQGYVTPRVISVLWLIIYLVGFFSFFFLIDWCSVIFFVTFYRYVMILNWITHICDFSSYLHLMRHILIESDQFFHNKLKIIEVWLVSNKWNYYDHRK